MFLSIFVYVVIVLVWTAKVSCDELYTVDMKGLLTSRRLKLVVIGQDVLETNGKVGSKCTVLTDNYCENAYDLLHTPYLKKLLLAGILLDTENLDSNSALSTNKDAEAVQLLLVGSAPRYRYELFEQLNEKLARPVPATGKAMGPAKTKRDVNVRAASAPAQITALETVTRVKNRKFSLLKLFGILSK